MLEPLFEHAIINLLNRMCGEISIGLPCHQPRLVSATLSVGAEPFFFAGNRVIGIANAQAQETLDRLLVIDHNSTS